MGRTFIAVGENIHCTRIYKVGGIFVKQIEGKDVILYRDGGEKKSLSVPSLFTDSEDWKNGKVKHAAVGMWQGIHGKDEETRQAGRDYIVSLAKNQKANGASYLDVNVDEFSTDVEERIAIIRWTAEVIQASVDLPLSIDSSNMEILEAGLEACDRQRDKPMVNSVSLERFSAAETAGERGAVVIAGAAGEDQLPASAEDRLDNFGKLLPRLFSLGFKEEDIFLDPLVFPISVDQENGNRVSSSVLELRKKYGDEIHFAPGLSTISFGMPGRKLLNQVFSWLCMQEGLDGGIVDPAQINEEILDSLDTESEAFNLAKDVLTGKDEFGMNYITASREGKL